ncbi:hypothetical protein ACFULT_22605 [Rhodococcus sp. NPDC057297]|uniref:hypothetical protein n=1 Tax=Rhodococcus sp. NPDC057297 TaxID=3346090 RepID=UPI003638D3D2
MTTWTQKQPGRSYVALTRWAIQGLGRPKDGVLTRTRFLAAFVFPAFVLGYAASAQPEVETSTLLSGASIISGVLLALCTLSVTRVKDLAATDLDGSYVGSDPMVAGYGFARSATAAAYVSVSLTAVVFAQLLVSDGPILVALTIATFTAAAHLGARIWFLLGAIRYQVDSMAGQRATKPQKLRRAG